MMRHASLPARAFFLLLFLVTCISCNAVVDLNLPTDEPISGTRQADLWYEIYFTNPSCPPEIERQGGIDQIIADDLLQATNSVDVAAFDLDAQPIVDALLELKQRGVRVRIVTDDQNEDLTSIRQLRSNDVSVVTDDRSALMHNKFIIIDEHSIWTGSLNYTSNGVYCNNNNAVRFDVPEIAANYKAEMDEMYVQRQFGPRSPLTMANRGVFVDDVLIETYFAPEEKLAPVIAQRIASAKEEILFMAFSFTEEQIGTAMLERAAAGVSVQGVFETTGSQTSFSLYPQMRDEQRPNLQVRQDGNPRIMHHKVIILDRQTVIFGSLNFSANANESNDENVVIVDDDVFAEYFVEEFGYVWEEAQP